ncbi:hypothetical protein ACS0TY_022945 [Phlomoides rotata]
MSSVVGLAVKPLLLAKQSCIFGVRSVSIVVQTWFELLKFAFSLHFVILWRIAIWSVGLLSLPVRAFSALYRERLLEMQLYRLKNEMESLLWGRKDLEDQLRIAINHGKMMEMMLLELEQEHDEAILKIEQLQGEVQDLKAETQQFKEIHGKALWSRWDNTGNQRYTDKSSWKPDYNKGIRQDDVLESGSKVSDFTNYMSSQENNFSVAKQREIALSRTLFSAILWLVVGVVVSEAKEAYVPLVVALFAVVTMSLMSVVRLFTNIEDKLALALLSTNCFILGTLAYPMLPSVARFSAPLALSFLQRTLV